ncbi:MAG: hypothetical protein QOG75_3163, partial [Mycobacterium sp.]|nr:hypothetical protein [Mycobacterium sp.]
MVAVAGLGHRAAQPADEVQRAERVVGRAVEDLLQRRPLADGDLQQRTPRQRWVGGGGRPEPSVTQRLGRLGERGAQHHCVGAAGDGFGQLAGRVDVPVGEHMHVAAAGLVEVFAPCRGGVGDRSGHRHADPEYLVAGGHSSGGPVADDDTGCSGAHQMQRRAVVEHPTGHHGHVKLGDEGLQVQRLAVPGDTFGGDDGALDDQQVDA